MINKNGFLYLKDIKGIPLIIDPIPETTVEYKNTVPMIPKYIVVHNAGSPQTTATATNLNKYMKQDDYKIWHFSVDHDSIVQGHSVFKSGFHAGDGKSGKGNGTGIGIEIADKGSDEEIIKAINNAFHLIQLLENNIPDIIIKPHQFFSGKYCPRWILDHWGWNGFIERYEEFKKSMIPDHWALKHWKSLQEKSIVIHEKRFDDQITRGEVFALLDRIIK